MGVVRSIVSAVSFLWFALWAASGQTARHVSRRPPIR
jgi:hypothetical protein